MVYVEFFKSCLELLLITVCVMSIALLGGLSVLQKHFADMSGTIVVAGSPYIQKNREIKTINADLRLIDEIQKEYILWTPLLTEFVEHIPNGIQLTSFDIDMGGKTLKITGIASRRDDLIALPEALESLSWIDDADIPLSQLLDPEPISFSLQTPIIR